MRTTNLQLKYIFLELNRLNGALWSSRMRYLVPSIPSDNAIRNIARLDPDPEAQMKSRRVIIPGYLFHPHKQLVTTARPLQHRSRRRRDFRLTPNSFHEQCPLQREGRGPNFLASTHFLFTILTCAQRSRVHFCPQHWLELELIQTQMTQKPMLRAEVYAHALRASRNREENRVQRAGSIILTPPSKVETVHEIILKPDLSRFLCHSALYWFEFEFE